MLETKSGLKTKQKNKMYYKIPFACQRSIP